MTLKSKIAELKAGIAALDAILAVDRKCMFCGEIGPWHQQFRAAHCGCIGVACQQLKCTAYYDYKKAGCDTCRLKRLTSCLMCGQDYGGYGNNPQEHFYTIFTAKCGCRGYGNDCLHGLDTTSSAVDGRTCSLDPKTYNCHKCRTK